MRALVSADDVVATVTEYLDHVHDAAVRLGCGVQSAAAVTSRAAGGLIDDLLVRPEAVGDLVGALFGGARESAMRSLRTQPAADAPVETARDPQVRAALRGLGTLPERRRLGVLLIDSYGVTYAQAGIALGLDAAETARTVALGRAALVHSVDAREVPPLAGHDTAIGDLGMLSDGSAPAGGRFAGLRRHVSNCATCAGMLAVQTRGSALVSALPTVDLDRDGRDALLTQVRQQADAGLPSADQVRAELSGEVEEPPLISITVVAIALFVALVLGAVLGVLLAGRDQNAVVAQRACNISATRNASSIDCPVFSRGSHAVS